MTEEVADVVLLGARFKQAARELAPQVMEAQAGDAGTCARSIPRHLDRFDLFAAFIAEDEGRGRMLGSIRRMLSHGYLHSAARRCGPCEARYHG